MRKGNQKESLGPGRNRFRRGPGGSKPPKCPEDVGEDGPCVFGPRRTLGVAQVAEVSKTRQRHAVLLPFIWHVWSIKNRGGGPDRGLAKRLASQACGSKTAISASKRSHGGIARMYRFLSFFFFPCLFLLFFCLCPYLWFFFFSACC